MPFARAGVGFLSGALRAASASGAEYTVAELGFPGVTDRLTGAITLDSSLSAELAAVSLRHELVHQYVLRNDQRSARPGLLWSFRCVDLRQ